MGQPLKHSQLGERSYIKFTRVETSWPQGKWVRARSKTFVMVGEMSSWLNYLAPLATPRAQEIDQKYEMEDGSAKPDLSGHNFSCLSWK
jgi:hypothetical protein